MLPAQLDLDGRAHEIAPQTERMRLFEPAPTQLAGQTHLDTDTTGEHTMPTKPTKQEDWQDAFPLSDPDGLTPEQRGVIAEVRDEIGREPFVTLDPHDYSDGEDDEAPVLVWTMPEPWTEKLGVDDDAERATGVFAVEADGTCHIGGNIGAGSWKDLRDALDSFSS